ncbi:hypothetical protein [Chenggangzhangella methanolivorans]|uniref:Uncharacterized protein n=2 Tax=Chenggangzhangella methanolivorans TaxID=1437009 RepID=A0A9E6R8P5_9HYPH|nr:hypothetical protein [Chenggangzhangella methanolivorans]QZN99354.1 hypothetical protein K6K41_21655 [Chenggangzhangella methanolivorans]
MTRRALNTAVSALTDLSKSGWVLPPEDLRARLAESFTFSDPKKYAELSTALDHVESVLWTDLNSIETSLTGESCHDVEKTFDYLNLRRKSNERAYAIQVGAAKDLIDIKRAAALKACAAAGGPPVSADGQ